MPLRTPACRVQSCRAPAERDRPPGAPPNARRAAPIRRCPHRTGGQRDATAAEANGRAQRRSQWDPGTRATRRKPASVGRQGAELQRTRRYRPSSRRAGSRDHPPVPRRQAAARRAGPTVPEHGFADRDRTEPSSAGQESQGSSRADRWSGGGTGTTPGARRGDGPPGGNCPASRTARGSRGTGKSNTGSPEQMRRPATLLLSTRRSTSPSRR